MSASSYSYPICDLLTNVETPLGKLIAQARAIENLNQSFCKMIDPALTPHCRVGTFENGILTLFAENASYATRLRYQVPTILSTLRNFSQWANLRSIQVKVQTHIPCKSTEPRSPTQNTETLSDNTLENISTLIAQLKAQPGNDALISSLERFLRDDHM